MNKMKYFVMLFVLLFICAANAQNSIEGIVFIDGNKNGLFDDKETKLPNVLVSNGRDVVCTNEKGEYKISTIKDNLIFVIKPTGYISKVDSKNKLQFYTRALSDKRNQKHNFPLYQNVENDDFNVALLGDVQVDVMDDIYHVGKLVTEELADTKPDFIVPLGDLSFDNLEIFQPLSETLGLIGSPIFYVIGNHDLDFRQETLERRDESFEKNFGPSYYAFEYGHELFLVLNNIYPKENRHYEGRIDENQLTFIKNLIQYKSKEHESIKIFMHIPLEEVVNSDELIDSLQSFKDVFIASGHTHTQYHRYHEREGLPAIHELISGAVCGSWWQGPHDIRGIPFAMMDDGTPKGYWLMQMNDSEHNLRYKVSGADANKQMNIWVPETNEWDTALNKLNHSYVYANVFAADDDTNVMISFQEDEWLPMQKYEGVSPELIRFYTLQELGRYDGQKLSKNPKPNAVSKHLWRIEIPDYLEEKAYLIKIQAKNEKLRLNVKGNRVLWVP